jgi:sortase A
MRRFLRGLGTLMMLAGVAALVWAFVVWRWQDPFTGLYTRYEQHRLASQFDERMQAFAPPASSGGKSLVVNRQQLARIARRYRHDVGRGDAIGRIEIPRIGVHMVLVNGTDHDSLTKGPGRDLRTYMPGESELVYVAGHRTTYLAPFSHIDAIRPGDRLTVQMPYATFVYRVTGHVIVASTDLDRLRSHHREVLALQACHPRFFASHRYIVYARPVRITMRGGSTVSLAGSALAAGR